MHYRHRSGKGGRRKVMNVEISGAKIFARIPTGIPVLGDFTINETLVVSWIVMVVITLLCIYLTSNMQVENSF